MPYTRGPEYSRPFYQIIKWSKELVIQAMELREITLLGQNVNAYKFKKVAKEYNLSNLIWN